jgi:AraC-like DNA-binding protein
VVDYKTDGGNSTTIYHYPPTPQASLFFYIEDRIKVKVEGSAHFLEQPLSVIVGQQLTPVTIDLNRNHKAVRVGFHPSGLHRLLGFSMAESIDGHYNAEDVFGRAITEVNEQLHGATDSDAIKAIVECFLLKKAIAVAPLLPFDRAMRELLKSNGNVPIEKIASLACLSLRQFERVSKERIGMPPKLFARIVRFSKAYRLREEQPHLSWTSIAFECGYFDQMHLIRDFKQFAGVAPRTLQKELQKTSLRMQIDLRL